MPFERAKFRPTVQLFVCVNARDAGDALASGCGAQGPRVYAALKREVAARGRVGDVCVTRAMCLGHCPKRGCAVAVYPANMQLSSVDESDAPALLRAALSVTREP